MEVPNTNNDIDYYIDRTVMIPEKNGLNGFYKVIRFTNKLAYIRKLKSETVLYNINYDEISNKETKIYEAIISDEFETDKIRQIHHKYIFDYPIIYCAVVQYEI